MATSNSKSVFLTGVMYMSGRALKVLPDMRGAVVSEAGGRSLGFCRVMI
jgi:hypothetical protein